MNVSHHLILTKQELYKQHVAFDEHQAQQPFLRSAMTALRVGMGG
jgi:hypothetical protein